MHWITSKITNSRGGIAVKLIEAGEDLKDIAGIDISKNILGGSRLATMKKELMKNAPVHFKLLENEME